MSRDRDVVAPVAARALLAALGIPQLLTGVWAVIGPASWFAHFPGIGPDLVAGEPPYNRHLAVDAGAGFLTVGLIALWAARSGKPAACRLALLGYFAFGLPHLAYHSLNPAPGLDTAGDIYAVAALAFGIAGALIIALILRRASKDEALNEGLASVG